MPEAVRTTLYRHWNASGQLLYVGIAANPLHRTNSHRERSRWFDRIARIDVEWHSSREAALAAERHAIKTEAPWFNLRHVDPAAVPKRPLVWAVLHLGSGRLEGWYRDEADAQDVLEFVRDEFKSERFLLVKEQSPEQRMRAPQFSVGVNESGNWVLEARNTQISTD